MRRIVIVFLTTIAAVALLFSYHTSTNRAADSGLMIRQRGSSGAGAATFTGEVADTRWGPVQVRISVQGGKITTSEAVQYPRENRRDVQINEYALPILGQEALQQQSASIDAVSGATVTSDGYARSLQSAIGQAHL
jgi:uncharacterized protein with FMN-binding domain